MRRFFGFGGDDEDDFEADLHAGNDMDDSDGNGALPAHVSTSEGDTAPVREPQFDPDAKAHILDGVLAVFNNALPDFLQRSIDPEAQRKALAESLDASVAEYLEKVRTQAESYAENKLRNASDAAHAETEKLRREMERLEQQKTNIREQQLSADRRRRALADRVNDLETQLAKAESEREQFELENRSLLNKIKLADVQPDIIGELQSEIERLKAAAASGGAPVADTAETDALRTEAESLRGEVLKLTADAERLQGELQKKTSENAELKRREADLIQAQDIAKQMYTDLQEELTGERENRKTAETELTEAKKIIETVRGLEAQLGQVQTVIARRDERIAQLKAANKSMKEELARANETLRRRDEDATSLFAIADADGMAAAEDDFECPDWFVSVPGPDTPPLRGNNNDFGYTEPPRKPKPPENDAQLSLF